MNETPTPAPENNGHRYGINICSRKFLIGLASPATVKSICDGLKEWEGFAKTYEDHMFPQHAVIRLKVEIGRCTCPVELTALNAKLLSAQSTDRLSIMQAQATVNTFLHEKLDLHLNNFFAEASKELLIRLAEVAELEAAFFGQFGLPEQPTVARKQLLSIAKELAHLSKMDELDPTLMALGGLHQPNRARWIQEGCNS